MLDDTARHVPASPGGIHHDGGQFKHAVAMGFDLTATDHLRVCAFINSHNEALPIQTGGVDVAGDN